MNHNSAGSKTTVRVGSNIAFIKYWGVLDETINIPLSNSISMTLADAHTTTTVAWDRVGALEQDIISLDGKTLDERAALRLVRHLDRLRGLAGVDYRARVASRNNFPMASGIASSASGFAALTVAGCTCVGTRFRQHAAFGNRTARQRLGQPKPIRRLRRVGAGKRRRHQCCTATATNLTTGISTIS